jgi:hypothetical protein
LLISIPNYSFAIVEAAPTTDIACGHVLGGREYGQIVVKAGENETSDSNEKYI